MSTDDKLRDIESGPGNRPSSPDEISPIDAMIGRQIRQRRELLGRTQADLAAFLGMKRPNATKIESGETPVTAANLGRIAAWLGVDDMNYFFDSISRAGLLEAVLIGHFRSMPLESQSFIVAAMRGVILANAEKSNSL